MLKITIPAVYSRAAMRKSAVKLIGTEGLSSRILCGLNRENIVKFFRNDNLSPTLLSIWIRKNKMGIPAPNAKESFESLKMQDDKKAMEPMARCKRSAPKFRMTKVFTSISPGYAISEMI